MDGAQVKYYKHYEEGLHSEISVPVYHLCHVIFIFLSCRFQLEGVT
jgi:hypothetical protein